jgi:hypothetical protein
MENRVSIPEGAIMGFFLFATASKGVKLTTYLHIVTRLRMSGSISPLPQ